VHDALVTDDGEDATTGVEVATLRQGDEALGEGAQALGLGLRRRDAAVLEQRGREVREQQPLVRGAAAEAGALGGGGH